MTLAKRFYLVLALAALLALTGAAITIASGIISAGDQDGSDAVCDAGTEDDANDAEDEGESEQDDCDDAGAGPTPQVCGTDSGQGCAPDSERVDLYEPAFTDPTNVTNPLFPISNLHSAILLGSEDGLPFRSETTLLPETRRIKINGEEVETLVSQYLAFLDGRIQEVALDFYAEADDGSVWYFGEDVFNYEDGVIADTDGTWLAGKDGPPAMIMPADPQVGDVYRPENAPGIVFEEVTVKSIGVTVDGPHGPVSDAIIVQELHMDGSLEDKTFAPGYGEFLTGNAGGDLEALALAVPTDALPGLPPAELTTLSNGADDAFEASEAGDWDGASATLAAMTPAWAAYQTGGLPPFLDAQMNDALDALTTATAARDAAASQTAAIGVARAALDFRLRYQPVVQIDLRRFDLWTKQALVDAGEEDGAAIAGDAATLAWVADRFEQALSREDAKSVEQDLRDLEKASGKEDFDAFTGAAERVRDTIAGYLT